MKNYFLMLLLAVSPAKAATNYVRAGATGAATGANWTDAFTDLPASKVRGDIYYVADGSYAAHTFTDNESGTTLITVKKATVADHGTETGWDNSYGDGQAVWPTWMIEDGYYDIDGQVGQWASDWPGYVQHGFKVETAQAGTALKIIQIGINGDRPSGISLRHIETRFTNSGQGSGWAKGGDTVYVYGGSDLLFQNLWIYNSGRNCFYHITGTNLVLEFSFLEQNGQAQLDEVFDPTEHSQLLDWGGNSFSTNSTYRYNISRRFRSTGGLMVLPDVDNSQIYGNLFTQDEPDATTGTRVLGGFNGEIPVTNIFIYNNTFFNISKGGTLSSGDWTNSFIRNNVFYNVKNGSAISFSAQITRSHNWYYDVGADMSSETSVQIGSGDPFVNAAADNYRLTAQTDAGFTPTLSATDMDGVAITWPTRGAFEHTDQVVPYPTSANINGNVRVRGRVTIGP